MSSCTVVIACHTADRWDLLQLAIESARNQSMVPAAIVVVVDHNPELAARLRTVHPDVTILPNTSLRGASGARNTGAFHADTEYVAFLDDDAVADREWLAELLLPFEESDVVGVGGWVDSDWVQGRPVWFPPEFDWVVGASYTGGNVRTAKVRNVWAENMAVRMSAFAAVGGFRTGFGKLGAHSRPEDTDLCIRMASDQGLHWVQTPTAIVSHHVPPSRSTYSFFVRRCYHEGRGKAELAALLPVDAGALTSEGDYVRRTLVRGLMQHLVRAVKRRSPGEAAQGASIVVGLGATVFGFLLQQLVHALRGGPDSDVDAERPCESLEAVL